MISLFSFIIVLVGAFNWLSIGILQFDFIAGIFGSQANIFSRIVYTIVGFSAFWLIFATIKQKGKIFVNGRKENDVKLLGKLGKKLTESKNEQSGHSTNATHQNQQNNNSNHESYGAKNQNDENTQPQEKKQNDDDVVPPIEMKQPEIPSDFVGITDKPTPKPQPKSDQVDK